MTATTSIRTVVAHLWRTDRALTATALLMLIALAGFLVGLAIDPRVITGAPAWLKPAKFAVSIAIYSATLAWMFSYLEDWPRVRRLVGWTTALVLILEMAIIGAQAWRGTTSHFNVSTPLDAALFSTMGAAIVLQTSMSVLVAVALWRQRFVDRALGWALRLGMTITIVGGFTGGLMVGPTEAQLAQMAVTHRMPVAGAHTVGAPDGGPGLPGTGWSRSHGDLRVPHFLGLHAMQALPILSWLLWRRRVQGLRRVRLVLALGAGYGGLFLIALWQALRGQSVMEPDAVTLLVVLGWAVLTGLAVAWPFRAQRRLPPDADATLNWINP